MGLGLKQDKPTNLELRRGALEADEHFQQLPSEVQGLKREALVQDEQQILRMRKSSAERDRSSMLQGAGWMLLIWGTGTIPSISTFLAAIVLGLLLGLAAERAQAESILYGVFLGTSTLLLGCMTGTTLSMLFMPIMATMLGSAVGATR
ncbi:MAG: hypothetical protein ACI9HE_004063 [Planctomycetota bacterium]|jgi:hypothetical protein